MSECKCDMCGKPKTFSCPLCGGADYCCEKCQSAHWVQHSQHCNVEFLDDPSMTVAMPFDLVDEDDRPVNFRMMEFVPIEGEYETGAWVLESEHPDQELIGEHQLVARMVKKRNLGKGRPPTDAEKGEIVTMTVKFVDRKTRRKAQVAYSMKLSDNMIYDGNPDELIKRLVSMRKRSREHGIVLWKNLEKDGEKPMRITTDGYMTIVVKRANGDEYTIGFRIRNIRPLSWGVVRKIYQAGSWFDKRFKTGVTGRNMLKTKGLTPTHEHKFLHVHDKKISSDMQVVMVLRMGGGNFAELADFEVFIPDNMPTKKDTWYDTDAQINVDNVVIGDTTCYDGEIADVTALCMCLNDHIAQNKSDLVDFELDENDEIHQEIQAEISKAEVLLKTILPYQARLEDDKNAEISHQIRSGIAEASQLLAIGGKFRQIRWSRRISKGSGVGWAEDKVKNWLPNKDANKSKLKDIYGALQRAGVRGEEDNRRKLALMKKLNDAEISGSTTPWTTKAKKKFSKAKEKFSEAFKRKTDDEDEEIYAEEDLDTESV